MQMHVNISTILISAIFLFMGMMFIFYKDYISILLNIEAVFLFCLLLILFASKRGGFEGIAETLSLTLIVIVASETTLVLSILVRVFFMKADGNLIDRLIYKD